MKFHEKIDIHKDFWQAKRSSLIFIPTAHMVQYDMTEYKQRFYNPEMMWKEEIKRAEKIIDWPTDGIPTVRPNLGTIFIPAIGGQDFIIQNNQMPWPGKHLSVEQIKAIEETEISSALTMTLAEKFYEIHKAKELEGVCAYLPDTQGVFDILHLLRGDEIFYELTDKKEAVKYMLDILTDLYIKVSKKLKMSIGESMNSMIHGHGTQQGLFFPAAGVRLSEDTPTLLSPAMIDEFILPYMEKAAKPFGGAFVHFCGKHQYLYDRMCECDFVRAIDLGNPEMYDLRHLLKKCGMTNTVFYSKISANSGESWKEYLKRIAGIIGDTGARCVLRPTIVPKNVEECAKMYDFWRKLTIKH